MSASALLDLLLLLLLLPLPLRLRLLGVLSSQEKNIVLFAESRKRILTLETGAVAKPCAFLWLGRGAWTTLRMERNKTNP